MTRPDRTPQLLPMDPRIVDEILTDAIFDTQKLRGGFPAPIKYEIGAFVRLLIEVLSSQTIVLAWREKVVRIAEPPAGPTQWPVRAVDVRDEKPVSTPDLRRHVFAAYAQAMALYGIDAAFEAAVNETLRRQKGWNLATAVDHARKMIAPAYSQVMPPKRPSDPGDDGGPTPGAPAKRAA